MPEPFGRGNAVTRWLVILLCGATIGQPAAIAAAADQVEPGNDEGRWQPLPDAYLQTLRGGFDLVTGMKISFGIERVVYINGILVTSTVFTFGVQGKNSTENMQSSLNTGISNTPAGALVAVQNGQVNLVRDVGTGSNLLAGTIIQNSLDNQVIRSMTVINATTNSLQVLKGLYLGGVLRDAIGGAVGTR